MGRDRRIQRVLCAALLVGVSIAGLNPSAQTKGSDPSIAPRPELVDPAPVNPGAITPSNAVPAPLTVPPTSSPLNQPTPGFRSVPRPEIQTPPAVTVPALSGGGSASYSGVVGIVRIELARPKEMTTLLATWGLTVQTVSGDQRTVTAIAPAGTDLRALLKLLRDDARVSSAELDALGFVPPAR